MLTTLAAAVLFFAVIVIGNAAILLAIASLLRASKAGFASSTLIAAINPLAQILILAGLFATYEQSKALMVVIVTLGSIIALAMPVILIRRLFVTKWGRSVAIYFLWGICGSLFNVSVAIGLRTFVLEAFDVPTNAMAPTVAGVHRWGVCPHCGETMIVSTPLDQDGQPMTENKQGICSACLKSDDTSRIDPKVILGDRIISNKLRRPRRWDVVTYYPPEAPGVLYVHRLVGLPGESVLVKDGQIWIDGVALSPPADLIKLKYADSQKMAESGIDYGLNYGVGDQPCHLADDECFVLGDNTLRSSDSRFFGPVKMDQITGVVTMRYWPPSRAKILRNSSEPLP